MTHDGKKVKNKMYFSCLNQQAVTAIQEERNVPVGLPNEAASHCPWGYTEKRGWRPKSTLGKVYSTTAIIFTAKDKEVNVCVTVDGYVPPFGPISN